MFRLRALAVSVLVFGLTLVVTTPAQADRFDKPPVGWTSFSFKQASCVSPSIGTWVALGRVRTDVLVVGKGRFYQEVKVQIDRLALGQQWRKMESRTYDWSRFTLNDTPTHSTSGVKTAVGATIVNGGGGLSVKVTVLLRKARVGPDPIVWKYVQRSPSFTCNV